MRPAMKFSSRILSLKASTGLVYSSKEPLEGLREGWSILICVVFALRAHPEGNKTEQHRLVHGTQQAQNKLLDEPRHNP